ncbi:MAG: 50S ribosomal protein L3 [Candidatus Woesearchaeota archaeon]
MPTTRKPRKGSMQYWPRKRARRQYARVRHWAHDPECRPLGFAGYKVGMIQAIVTDNRKNSLNKGQDASTPVTVIECPPLKVASVRFYKKTPYGMNASKEITSKTDKELARKIRPARKSTEQDLEKVNPDEYDDMSLLVYTQPKLTGIGKKKPEIFELALGGDMKSRLDYAKKAIGKEINISDVFQEGSQADIHSITKGKGTQGPVKRFGIRIRAHKSEKTKRGPGSLGAWKGHGHFMYRIAHAGQTGYQTRTEFNKHIIKIEQDVSKVNPSCGFARYGLVKNTVILLRGSIPGPRKRMIKICKAARENKRIPGEAPTIKQLMPE